MPTVSRPSVLDSQPHVASLNDPAPRSTPEPAIPPARSLSTRRTAPIVVGMAALLLVGGAGWSWLSRSDVSLQEGSPLEPTAATERVLVPAADDAPVNSLASAAVAAADGTSRALGAVSDTFVSLRGSLDLLTGRVDSLEAGERSQNARIDAVEGSDRAQSEQIAVLRNDVDRIGVDRLPPKATEPSPAGPPPARTNDADIRIIDPASRTAKPAPKPRRATPAASVPRKPASQATAAADVLAVDLWGGKPSVVVARTGAGGATELRFINEGETAGRVTLKHADIGSQEATFATPSGDKTLTAKEN